MSPTLDHCPVCGALCTALPHCCDSVGPRIGQQAPRCVRPPGHDSDHQAHASWNAAVDADAKPLTWTDLRPAAATDKILDDMMAGQRGSPSLLDAYRRNHETALKALAAAGYSVVRFDVADLAHIIRTADGDRLARSDELAAHIIDALTKET